jgi:hypothetical protein
MPGHTRRRWLCATGSWPDLASAIGPGCGVASDRWNHNIHYHRVIVDAVPPACEPSTSATGKECPRTNGARSSRAWSAPIGWPPPDTYGRTRDTAQRLLPGVRYRRRLVWRYSLVWVKPG